MGSARVSRAGFGVDFVVLTAKHKTGGRSSRDAGSRAGMLREGVPMGSKLIIFQ